MTAADRSPQPLLVTVSEAAGLLGIARSHLYLHLQSGSLPSVRIGRCRRVSLSDLDDFIASHREDADQESSQAVLTPGLAIGPGQR